MTPQQAPSPPAAPPDTNGAPEWALDPEEVAYLEALEEAAVTEDGTPVDNIFTEHQLPLLTEPLDTSWPGPGEGRRFLVLANVGWFTSGQPPLAPDVLLSLDVSPPEQPRSRSGRSYFQWRYGKPPDLVIEIVSDRRGDEGGFKMTTYARLSLPYYVIFDPDNRLEGGALRGFELHGRHYQPIDPRWIADIGLGLILWPGTYRGVQETWLRWCDQSGTVIPTGAERARQAEERIARLAAQIRALGGEPEA